MSTIKIESSKNKITIGKQSIELTLTEMRQLRDKLNEILEDNKVVLPPISHPPYKSPMDEINPERPWRDDLTPPKRKYPFKGDYPKVWTSVNTSEVK